MSNQQEQEYQAIKTELVAVAEIVIKAMGEHAKDSRNLSKSEVFETSLKKFVELEEKYHSHPLYESDLSITRMTYGKKKNTNNKS